MPRTTKEWVGKTDNSMPPRSVRLRIFEREKGMCFFAKRKIRAGELWDLHHKIELWEGGENRETNLFPALRGLHREHSAKQQTVKAKADKSKINHYGMKRKGKGWQRTMNGRPITQKVSGQVVYSDTGEPV